MAITTVETHHALGAGLVLSVYAILDDQATDPLVQQCWKLRAPGHHTRQGWFRLKHRDLGPLLRALDGQSYEVVLAALTLTRCWAAGDLSEVVPTARSLCT